MLFLKSESIHYTTYKCDGRQSKLVGDTSLVQPLTYFPINWCQSESQKLVLLINGKFLDSIFYLLFLLFLLRYLFI